MRILDINIPDTEIDALAPTQRRILYTVTQAHPVPIGIGILLKVAGSGCQTRRKHLNENFLALYGLTIESKPAGVNEAGTQVWAYSFRRVHKAQADEKGNFCTTPTRKARDRPPGAWNWGKLREVGGGQLHKALRLS